MHNMHKRFFFDNSQTLRERQKQGMWMSTHLFEGALVMQHTQQQSSSKKIEASSRQFPRFFAGVFAALGAGLLASLLGVVLMGILRLAAGIPTPVELFSY